MFCTDMWEYLNGKFSELTMTYTHNHDHSHPFNALWDNSVRLNQKDSLLFRITKFRTGTKKNRQKS